MRVLLGFLLCGLLLSCYACSPPAPQPPPPAPTPVPPDPVPPEPIPPTTHTVPWAAVQQVAPGMTRDQLIFTMEGAPLLEVKQDDGTYLLRWLCYDASGAVRKCDVQLLDGLVLGYGLWR